MQPVKQLSSKDQDVPKSAYARLREDKMVDCSSLTASVKEDKKILKKDDP